MTASTSRETSMSEQITQGRDQVRTARAFAAKWAGRGYEKGDTASFWLELCGDVLGMPDVTTNVRFEKRTNHAGFIDGIIPDAKTIIEQKSAGIDLDKKELRQGEWVTPFEQAWRYARSVKYSQMPRYIVVSNFQTFRIHDLEADHPDQQFVALKLSELPDQLRLFEFLSDHQQFLTEHSTSEDVECSHSAFPGPSDAPVLVALPMRVAKGSARRGRRCSSSVISSRS